MIRIGTPGYIQHNKNQSLIKTSIGFISFLLVYGIGVMIIGDNKSYFTIVAALIILPTAQFAAKYFAYRGYHSVKLDLVEATEFDDYIRLYELLLVRGKHTYYIDVAMIAYETVYILCQPNNKHKEEHNKIRQSIQTLLNQKGIKVTVLSFDSKETLIETIKKAEVLPMSQQLNQQEGIAKALSQSGM